MIKAVIFDLDNTLLDFMKMKSISINARLNMEKALNQKIHLFLEVKLKKKKATGTELVGESI